MTIKHIGSSIAILISIASHSLANDGSYDLSNDFSPTANPAGAWSYGAKASLNGPFSLFGIHGFTPADGGVPFQYWQLVPLQEPTLFRNGTANLATIGGGQGTIPAGAAYLFSGTDGAANGYGVVRFSVPVTGNYRIQSGAQPVYTTLQGDTDFHVVRNGQEVFGRGLSGQQSASYSNILSLVAGDTLDFMVGRGADNSGYASGLIIAAGLTFMSDGPACSPLPSGLVSWWRGDESPADSTGANPGGLRNGAGFAAGKVGQGFLLDGVNDDVLVADSDTLDLSEEFTVELWFRRDQPWVPNVQFTLFNKRDGARDNYGASLSVNYGLILYYKDPQAGDYQILAHNPLPTTQAFHHFAGVFRQVDATHVELRSYLDGRVVTSGQFAGNLANARNTASLTIGSAAGASDFFQGVIDEVSIYRRALSEGEIEGIYKAGEAGKCSPATTPVIVSQPQSQTVNQGSDVVFTVVAQGAGPFNYQWLFNGHPIAYATGAELRLLDVTTNEAGIYAVTVANSGGSVTSSNATLMVVPSTPPPVKDTYDLSNDFSPTANPAGAWSYGAKASLNGPFSLFGIHGFTPADGGVPFQYWQLVPQQEPTLFRNGTANLATIGGGQGTIPPGAAYLFSGTDGAANGYGVVRFSVPVTGNYRVQSGAQPVYTTLQGDTDFHVVRNGQEVFGRGLSGQQSASYSNILSLVAGDTLDFMVGRGADNSGYASGLIIAAGLTFMSDGPACSPLPSGLVSWWRGDESPADSTGANPGGLRNGAGFAAGKVGQGFLLDGVNDDVLVADSDTLDLGEEFTIELWFRRDQPWVPNVQFTLFNKRDGVRDNYGASLSVNYGLILYYKDPQAGDYQILAHNPLPTTNAFHHFAGVFRQVDPTHVELRSYLDGRLVKSGQFPGDLANTRNAASLTIGSAAGASDFFQGVIDEVSIYRRALSEGEIEGIYKAGEAGKCSSPATTPVIVSQPQSQTVNQGSDVVFNVVAQGAGPLNYQWLFNGHPIADATGAELRLLDVTTNEAGIYAVTVANSGGSVTSSNATLMVVPSTPPPVKDTYDLSNDFSPTANPAGAWSYGAKTSLNGAFSLFGIHGFTPADGGVPFQYWQLVPLQEPTLFRNGTANPATIGGGQGTIPPGTAYLFSGTDGAANPFGVVRFTVPATDTYSIQASASPVYNTALQGDTDFHVVRNGTELFGRFLSGQQAATYSMTLTLTAGETIDFMVGRGADNAAFGSGLKLFVRLRAHPPASQLPVARFTIEPLLHLFEGQEQKWVLAVNNTDAVVTLDGSASFDPDGDVLDYLWLDAGQGTQLGVTRVVTNRFELGTQRVSLLVSDGVAGDTETVEFEVITPAEAVAEICGLFDEAGLSRRYKRPFEATLQAAANAFERGQLETGANLLNAFQHKVRAQLQPSYPQLADALIRAAGRLIDALETD